MNVPDRMRRDRQLFDLITKSADAANQLNAALGIPNEPLSVVSGETSFAFPLREDLEGHQLPRWKDLSDWMKAQMAVLAMGEFACEIFHANLHPGLESKLVTQGREVRSVVRDRLRKELAKAGVPGLEHFSVIEGWDKWGRKAVRLHLHGAAFTDSIVERDALRVAARRATGNDLRGSTANPRAYSSKPFYGGGARLVDYIFKNTFRPDHRLGDRRLAMSEGLTQGARAYYEMISGR